MVDDIATQPIYGVIYEESSVEVGWRPDGTPAANIRISTDGMTTVISFDSPDVLDALAASAMTAARWIEQAPRGPNRVKPVPKPRNSLDDPDA